MKIVRATTKDSEECVNIIFETEMGKRYYPARKFLQVEVEKGIEKDECYIAKSAEGEILGVLWYQQEGIFHAFPYLHMIAVRADYRNRGIGGQLLDFFEKEGLAKGKNPLRTKVFLTVGDFNSSAEKIYINKGYIKVCDLEGLFKKNITEKLYMKIVYAVKKDEK